MSIMTLPALITGSNEKNRKQNALDLASKYSGKFDINFFDTYESAAIGELRIAIGKIHRKPYESPYQTLVIFEANNLSIEAQNSLLKTLEEPPAKTVLILTSPTKESLLTTITSRCNLIELTTEKRILPKAKIESFFNKKPLDQFRSLDSFDLDEWLEYWREIVRKNIFAPSGKFRREDLQRSLNYTRFLVKSRRVIRKKVSQKIVKTLILLETPFFN